MQRKLRVLTNISKSVESQCHFVYVSPFFLFGKISEN